MAYVSVKATADANSYQKTMKSMAAEAKALASQWTATQAKAKAFGSQTEVLTTKATALSDKIKLPKRNCKTGRRPIRKTFHKTVRTESRA